MNNIKIDGLTQQDYFKFMSPIKTMTDGAGKLTLTYNNAGKIFYKEYGTIHHVFRQIANFFRRLAHLLFHSSHHWENDDYLITHLKTGMDVNNPEQIRIIRALYNEFKLRLPNSENLKGLLEQIKAIPHTDEEILQTLLNAIKASAYNSGEEVPLPIEIETSHNKIIKLKGTAYIERSGCPQEMQDSLPIVYKKEDLPEYMQCLSPLEYIYEEELKTIADLSSLPSSIKQYISVQDMRRITPNYRATMLIGQSTNFAFKAEAADGLGIENTRELLAMKLLASLGLDTYFVKKKQFTLSGATIEVEEKNQKKHTAKKKKTKNIPKTTRNLKNPEGLICLWIEGDEFPKNLWEKHMAVMKELSCRGGASEKNIQEYDQTKTGLEEFGCYNSIQEHALVDALLGSSDSHIGQYIRKKGTDKIYNIDFSRFLIPEFFKEGTALFFNLKSLFLDHPASYTTMNPSLIQRIEAIDIEQISQNWIDQELVGEATMMSNAAEELELLGDLTRARGPMREKLLKDIYKKIGTTDVELLKKYEVLLKKQCFSKIHPVAFQQFLNRLKALKNYIKESSSPTVKGAFEAMYPLIKPFMQVLQRVESNPSLAIGYRGDNVGLPRVLDSLLSEAQTEEERKLLENNLKEIDAQASERIELSTIIDFN